MRFLGVLGLVLVHARRVGNVIRAEAPLDFVPRGHDRLGRHVDAVGPHVGDVAGLVEPLGGGHAGLGAHAELAAGLLLQGGGHEGRIGVAGGRFRLDRLHGQVAGGDRLHREFRGGGIGDVELVKLLAAKDGQPRLVFLPARGDERRSHRPVFARLEGLDLHLALDDQAQADRLHPSRRFRAGQLAPENRGKVEADEVIERAAGQISLHQRRVDVAGMGHRLGHGGFGDRVEGDAADGLALLDRRRQCLLQVP